MTTRLTRHLQTGFPITCVFAIASCGCVAAVPGDEPSVIIDDSQAADVARLEATASAVPPPPIGCAGGSPMSDFVNCYYDAPELRYSDGWKCTPPGDEVFGRCKTTTVGKSVSFTFYTQQWGSVPPGIYFLWRPSSAQGSVQVRIDGINMGLVWQGEDSMGGRSYPLAPGIHTIELSKPARDGDRAVTIQLFGNGE
jgi:hypothetical protein